MNKYLFVLPNFKIGGAERIVQMILINLKNKNIEFDLFFLSSTGDSESWKDIKYIVLGKYQFFSFLSFFYKQSNYSYSFTTHYYINYFMAFLRILNKIDIGVMIFRESTPFFSRYNFFKKFVIKCLHNLLYNKADKIIFQSEFMLEDFNKNVYSCENHNKIVLNNPIFFKRIDNLLKFDLKSNDLVLHSKYWVAMGRLIPEKGFDILIESYCKFFIKDKFHPLYIFGEGPEIFRLTKLIDKFKMNEYIFIRNYLSNPYPIIKNASSCIISSKIEGFPNVLNEMIYLNDNILSTICVPEISKLEFISVCLPNCVDSLGKSLTTLNDYCPSNIDLQKKIKYLSTIDLENFVIRVF